MPNFHTLFCWLLVTSRCLSALNDCGPPCLHSSLVFSEEDICLSSMTTDSLEKDGGADSSAVPMESSPTAMPSPPAPTAPATSLTPAATSTATAAAAGEAGDKAPAEPQTGRRQQSAWRSEYAAQLEQQAQQEARAQLAPPAVARRRSEDPVSSTQSTFLTIPLHFINMPTYSRTACHISFNGLFWKDALQSARPPFTGG